MKKQNQKHQFWLSSPLLITTFMFLVLVSQTVAADNYLDELAVEAEATASVSKKSQLSPHEREEFKKMEEILADKKPSAYKFYEKLNKKNKVYAYEAWAADMSTKKDRVNHLRKKVMDLYFSQ